LRQKIHAAVRECVLEHRNLEAHSGTLTNVAPDRLNPSSGRNARRDHCGSDNPRQFRRGWNETMIHVFAFTPEKFRYASLDCIKSNAAKRLDIGHDYGGWISAALEWQCVEQNLQRL